MTQSDFKQQRIIFFDGVCGLCNWAVDWLMKHDRRRQFLYSPLQGKTAEVLLSKQERTNLSTFIYWRNGEVLHKSDAALAAINDVGRLWRCFSALRIVPRLIRNGVYDWVARHRYKWFGRKETCRIPSKEERELFLP